MKPIVCHSNRSPLALGDYSASSGLGEIPSSQTGHRRSIPDWVREISEAWARGAANTLHMARLVSQARHSLQYGGWSQLWRSGLWRSGQVPFSKRKGEMLVVIGSALGNLPAQTSAQLPSAWNTIYWVALLGGPVAEQLIQQGRVYPGLTLQEAKALLAEFHPERARKGSQSTVKQRVARFTAYVRGAVEKVVARRTTVRVREAGLPGGGDYVSAHKFARSRFIARDSRRRVTHLNAASATARA